ncbi:hypothetical protein LCGC14_2937190 [marine sediment metagenome]|uniref:Uncharacterized protein n=1 Tax=marine sediment metagenome TaxID=412755 RepID=A0A0F8XJQ6_9ZZZZ
MSKLLWGKVRRNAREVDRLLEGTDTTAHGRDPSACGIFIAKAVMKGGCMDEFLRRLRRETA